MFGIGFNELIIILVVALIVIGPKKLPEIAKTLGKGYREFKNAFDDVKNEINLDMSDDKEYTKIKVVGKDNKKDENSKKSNIEEEIKTSKNE